MLIAKIEFKEEKHCLKCPLRDKDNDSCRLQVVSTRLGDIGIEFEDWEEQMKNCPLVEVEYRLIGTKE